MIEILKNSFNFSKLFALRKQPLKAFVLYFLLIVVFGCLPLNLIIIRNNGWKLNLIVESLKKEELSWLPNKLPKNFIVDKNKGLFSVNDDNNIYEFTSANYTFIINGTEGSFEKKPNLIVLTKDTVLYYNSNLKELKATYLGLEERIDFQQLAGAENKTEAKLKFIEIIDAAFAPYFIFYSVTVWTLLNILMQTILLFMISAIFLLIRIKYQKVATYREYLRIYLASFTVPTIIAVLVGLMGEAAATLSPVILQFGTALMAIGAIYLGSKSEIDHPHTLTKQV